MVGKGSIPWNKGLRTGYSGSRKCTVDCTCKRHSNAGRKVGSLCVLDCQCGRHKVTDEWREKQRQAHKGRTYQSESIEKMRTAALTRWQSPEYAYKVLSTSAVRPNKLEAAVLDVLKPYGWRYVGDGSFNINGKNPDFWDGNRKVLEVYGDYWHRGQDPQDRIAHFEAAGYSCLVIWESEFRKKTEETIKSLIKFSRRA